MEQATLTISLPRSMKDFIGKKVQEGRFSTPSEYIRSLIRDDQDLNGRGNVVAIVRRLWDDGASPGQDAVVTQTGPMMNGTADNPSRRRISARRKA
jgi:putative addiction module CopG family antidote